MGFLEEKEVEMLADARREAKKNAENRLAYIKSATEKEPDGYKYVIGLSMAFIIVGIILMVGGVVMAVTSHENGVAFLIGGLLSSMICWAWASVTRVCGLYLKAHHE